MKVNVIVKPKEAVLDPQGNAVRDAMRHLGMPEVRSVRIGKYMEINIEGNDGHLEKRLHVLCRDLLSNPVIEDYELRKSEVRDQKSGVRKKTAFNTQRSTRLREAMARQVPNSQRRKAKVRGQKSLIRKKKR